MIESHQNQGADSKPEKPFENLLRLKEDDSPDVIYSLGLEELVDDTRLQLGEALFGTPFKETMQEAGYNARTVDIHKFESNPNVLVREHKMLDDQTLNGVVQSTIDGEREFAKLSEKYGVKVASMRSVVGKNDDGKVTVFTIVDKIEGENLAEIESLPTQAMDELDALYSSLGQHLHDAWKEDDLYWSDCNNSQFTYGNKVGEEDAHFYLVDVGAEFRRKGDNELFPIEWPLHNTCEGLVEAELKFQPRVRLEKARSKLLAIVNEMLEAKPGDEWLLKSKNLLES